MKNKTTKQLIKKTTCQKVTSKTVGQNLTMSVITLTTKGLNTSIKRQRLSGRTEKNQDPSICCL